MKEHIREAFKEFLFPLFFLPLCVLVISIFDFYHEVMSKDTARFLEFVAQVIAIVLMWFGGLHVFRDRTAYRGVGRMNPKQLRGANSVLHSNCEKELIVISHCFHCYPDTGLSPYSDTAKEEWDWMQEHGDRLLPDDEED